MYYRTVLQWLEKDAEKYPNKVAFRCPEGKTKSITFGNLQNIAKRIGAQLSNQVEHCHPVAFYLEKSVDAVCGMFGAVYAGGFYSFVDVRQPVDRANRALSVLQPDILITNAENADKAAELECNCTILRVEDLMAAPEPDRKALTRLTTIRANCMDTDPLYVNFTSGSTGTPKGIAVSHRSVIDFISHFVDVFRIADTDILANQAPFDFDVSVKDIYTGLFCGTEVLLVPRIYFSRPMELMDVLADQNVTVLIWAVSAMCFVTIMNALAYRTPKTIRLVMFSGEVMPPKHLNLWRKYLPDTQYVNLYGPTEITCNCTYYPIRKDEFLQNDSTIPIGKPFPNEKVFLLSEANKEILTSSVGEEGEICVAGTCLALGYYRNPEKTSAAFPNNPMIDSYEERIYRTGDLGKYDESGNLIFVSRKDFQIKHLGHRIELGEIENCAMTVDSVSRSCCIYDTGRKRILLFYTGTAEKKDLEAILARELPPFMMPNNTIRIDEMPLNKNGKIDRQVLQGLFNQAEIERKQRRKQK